MAQRLSECKSEVCGAKVKAPRFPKTVARSGALSTTRDPEGRKPSGAVVSVTRSKMTQIWWGSAASPEGVG